MPSCRAAESHIAHLAPTRMIKSGGAQVRIKVIQYNARSTSTGHAWGNVGKARRARNKALRLQFGALGARRVGVQEARNPEGA
eukprot:2361909-Pyramimonas_sp.AAC.1